MEQGSALRELIDVMHREAELYDELLVLAGSKKDVLIGHQVELLKEIVQRESEILKSLGKLELRRTPALAALVPEGGGKDAYELSAILPALDSPERDELTGIRERLQSTVKALNDRNAVNQKLIETQLQYTAFCIELMTGSGETGDSNGYGASINHPRPKSYCLLDQKV